MQKRLFAIIGEHYPALSKGQKKIADYICAHYEEAAYMTAGALGRTVSVSESTVVRFAVELGFSGYPALQSYMQELVKSHLTAAQRMEVSGRRISRDQVVEQVLSGDMELIKGTIQQVDTDAFDRVVLVADRHDVAV
ncbi:MAG: N-acetylmannosamine kinase, partial [Clostridiales bacterium]|nr:N-acetylmannosamine kinase [Clostridiales bacterium]